MGDFWKPTLEMYSSLFPKPKMDETLLKKPPFKYLFDILTETTKVTGFGKGLLNEEETSIKYYQTRQKKIAYLQKFIDLVKFMGREELQAKPAKIVAGLEPEHTNSMLQSIYKLAVSGDSSDSHVAKVLGGEKEEKVEKVQKPQKKQVPLQKSEKPSEKDLTSNKNIKETTQPQQNARSIRPPSAPRRGPRPTGDAQPAKEPKETLSRQGSRQAEKQELQQPSQRNIKEQEKQVKKQTQNYSKNVREAIEQNEQIKTANQQPPVKKVEMGNLRKRKNQSKAQQGGVIGAIGEINQKQLDSVKALIQSICQNSTPLSKSIQFLNDDVEAMNQQLNYWRKQYNVSKNKMQNELKITEDALVPLYDKLAQIDEQIKDQKSKIQNVKSQIIKNQSTINALLYSVVKG